MRPSERNLPALRTVVDAFLDTGEAPEAFAVSIAHGQRAIHELTLLGLVRHRYGRLCPTRNGLRRVSRLDELRPVAALYRALQGATLEGRTTQWNVERTLALFGRDERSTRIAMFLLDGAPFVQSLPCRDGAPVLYVVDHGELAGTDARALESLQPEAFPAESADALYLRYCEGERHFPQVTADGAALAGAILDGIEIDRGSMVGADLRGASLRGAQLGAFPVPRTRGADPGLVLIDSDLARSDLRGADLRATDLRGASLDGAQLDAGTAIPIDGLLSAKWEVVYREGVPHRREDPWPVDVVHVRSDGFAFVHDVGADAWEISNRGAHITNVPDSVGVRIAALLVANPRTKLHALDLDGLLERSPFRAARLDRLPYAACEVARLLADHGLPAARELSPIQAERVRACLRACDRLADSRDGAELRQQLEAALRKRGVHVHRIDYVKKAVDRVRRAYERARDGALAGSSLTPLVRAIRCGEFASYDGGST
jgi:hypothetical protein